MTGIHIQEVACEVRVMIRNVLAVAILFAAMLACLYWYVSLPIVVTSHSTGQCVTVMPQEAGDCDNLPAKYTSEWSK